MSSHVLAPVGTFDPWARSVGNTIVEMEDPSSVTPYLLHVFDEASKHAAVEELDAVGTSLDVLAASKSSVIAVAETLDNAGFACEIIGIETDDLARGILMTANRIDVDRMYLFGRRRSSVGKAVFGSTLQQVIIGATVPTVVVSDESE